MRERTSTLIAALAASFLVLAASAQASTVTIGSPLPDTLSPANIGTSRTITNVSLPEPGAQASAPANGTIVSWSLRGGIGGPFTLQVVHPASIGQFTSTGSTVSGPITGTGILSFPANLAIAKGDLIGIDRAAPSDKLGGQFTSGTFMTFSSPLGSDPQAGDPGTGEAGFNAQVLLNCIVPKLKGVKVGAARKKLAAAGCAAPKVKKKGGKFVKKQKPAAGTEIRGDTAVKLKAGPKR
jgi:PASTA domain-containing protein